MPSSTASCTPRTASRSTARPCANQRKKPANAASLTPTTPSEPLKPSTGELSAIIGMLSAITGIRNHRLARPESHGGRIFAGLHPTYAGSADQAQLWQLYFASDGA